MSIKRAIGGNRVGSGKKMEARLHNWYRSTFNLNEKWASSMGSGILYPCCVKLAMRGDRFDIDAEAVVRTIPTRKALFGSYKMQIDFYQCPVRLYQALLHNNPLALGLNMNEVKFPLLHIYSVANNDKTYEYCKMNDSSLLKYLGLSGLGTETNLQSADFVPVRRYINALPALAYYDIYKTYYANKQEENGYVIAPTQIKYAPLIYEVEQAPDTPQARSVINYNEQTFNIYKSDGWSNTFNIFIEKPNIDERDITYNIYINGAELPTPVPISDETIYTQLIELENGKYQIVVRITDQFYDTQYTEDIIYFSLSDNIHASKFINEIRLQEFPLGNIDDMRYDLLSHHTLGVPYVIASDEAHYPYLSLVNQIDEQNDIPEISYNYFPLNGLCIKTYQNDIFNNWLNTEWIEGENGINEISKVTVTDGKFSMDALIFARKRYNMLVRVAIAGGTYEDWQDVQYEEVKRRQIESPIFIGGMSQEIVFDEVVQTAPTDGNALGTIGCRGRNNKNTQNGGKFHVKCDEACFIIGIVSLTPRIFYTQGNEFYLTDIKSMDDIHKPALDGIGFQDLIGERMAWWDTKLRGGSVVERSKVGKLPAWIEYMTSVDKAYGDMAGNYGNGFMILNRNYERDEETGGIKDATTYVDPSKYNYSFAYAALDAQNFWVEIVFDIKARRLMSAKMIPQA